MPEAHVRSSCDKKACAIDNGCALCAVCNGSASRSAASSASVFVLLYQ
jgi:hypothetical protein